MTMKENCRNQYVSRLLAQNYKSISGEIMCDIRDYMIKEHIAPFKKISAMRRRNLVDACEILINPPNSSREVSQNAYSFLGYYILWYKEKSPITKILYKIVLVTLQRTFTPTQLFHVVTICDIYKNMMDIYS